jgi:peptide/nickel transport system substrate-binding protein
LALAALVAGCTNDGAGDPKQTTLRVGFTAMPDSMDMTTNTAAAIPQALLYNVYETLVKLDGDGKIRPLLATEWTVSPDRKTYTFTLQPSAKFASGTAVTADAVIKSFQRILDDPDVTAVNKTQMGVIAKMAAKDEHTVEITLTRPSNNWLYYLTTAPGIVIDPEGYADLATQTAGSGPFQLKEWLKGESITLEKNANYWGTPARFDLAVFKYYADANAMTNAMLSGDLDIVSNVAAPQTLGQFTDTSKYQIIKGTSNGEIVLGFNNTAAPLDNVLVRQAICYGIDRKALRDSVWAGEGAMIGSMVPPTDPWYEDLSAAYPYDPEKARALLEEAGVGEITLRLRIPTLPYATGSAQFIVSQLKEIGITVVVDELEFPARWVDVVMTQTDYDMTIVSHVEARDIEKWADPDYYWHYGKAEFAKLIADADQASEDDQIALMKQAAKMLSDDAAGDFLWLLPSIIVAKPDLTGIPQNSVALSFDLTTIASRNS